MTDAPDTRTKRRVSPRKWAAATLAGLAVASPVVVAAAFPHAALASEVGEAGEAGEGGVTLSEGPSNFLTQLGYFEGTYRIIAGLYLGGARDQAREHLELSHHAFYEDIEPALAEYGAPGFGHLADRLTTAVMNDAPDAEVAAALAELLGGLQETAQAAGASARERLMSVHELMKLAAAEYEGGVENGRVEMGMEYRDSWGFYETARQRALRMAESGEADLAQAGRDVLARLDGAEALYPGLTAETAATDPSLLTVAAGWIEIIALRQE